MFANDHEAPAVATFSRNHPEAKTTTDPIQSVDTSSLMIELGLKPRDLDVLLGGPPCQGFSTYGQRDPDDHRNALYLHFLRFLGDLRPKAFVLENVVGILSIEGGRIVEDILERAHGLGYSTSLWVLDAADFGVPQYRKRVFIVGSADGAKPTPPTTSTSRQLDGPPLLPLAELDDTRITVRDAISDLPVTVLPPVSTHEAIAYMEQPRTPYQRWCRVGAENLTHHSAKQMLGIRRLRLALLRPGDYGTQIRRRAGSDGLPDELIEELLSGGAGLRSLDQCRTQDRVKERQLRELLHRGHVDIDAILESLDSGGFANKYRRLQWGSPSHTLVAHMARDCSDFVHPEVDRFISVREAARLQSFPDPYYFVGSQFQQFRHIGNAVPPRLAEAVAESVLKLLPTGPSGGSAQELKEQVGALA